MKLDSVEMRRSDMFKALIGLTLFIGGIILGLWLGIWVMFIGGIVQFINGVKANPVDALALACGIARVIFAGFVGWGVGTIVCSIGLMIVEDSK